MEPTTTAIVVGTAVNAIGGLFGASKSASAAAAQAEMQNQAAIRKYGYDIQKMGISIKR